MSLHQHRTPVARNDAPLTRARSTRRQVLHRLGSAALGLGLLPFAAERTAAHGEADQAADAPIGVELPPDIGQSEIQVYVEATGHTLRGLFLDYWRANGAAAIYGNPISEPFVTDGAYCQAFERGIFQYRPEFIHTEEPIVRLMPVGQVAADPPLNGTAIGWRAPREGDGRSDPWRPLAATEDAVRRVLDAGGIFVEETGHTIAGEILAWYTFNEGAFYLGLPLSEPVVEGGATVQWFAGGLLRAGKDGVALAPLAVELAPRLGIDTAPVARGDLPAYDELLFWTADNPNPRGDPYAPGAKWVEVSIAEQRLWAYQGDTLLSTTLVSTGLDPNLTELGMFRIRLKYPVQDLSGFTNDTGEVIGFGDDPPPGAIPYTVEDVPHVMYFNLQAEALHGTYWHNNFGQKMSHGCVNLPLDVAAWLYGWAPLGTGVWVHA